MKKPSLLSEIKILLANALVFSASSALMLMNNFSDQYFVGLQGRAQVTAYSLNVPIFWILVSSSAALSAVYSARVKKHLTVGDTESANAEAIRALVYTQIFGLIFTAIVAVIMVPIFSSINEPDIADSALQFMLPILLLSSIIFENSVLGGLLTAEGKMKVYLMGLVVMLIANIIGDRVFVNELGMGIFGNGLSTVLGAAWSLLILASWYRMGKTKVKLSLKNFSWSLDTARSVWMHIRTFLVRHLTKDTAELLIRFMLFTTYAVTYGVPMLFSSLIAVIGLGAGTHLSTIYRQMYAVRDTDGARRLFIRSTVIIVSFTFLLALIIRAAADPLMDPFIPADAAANSKEMMVWTLGVVCFTAPFVGMKYMANAVSAPVGRFAGATGLLIIWASAKVVLFYLALDVSYEYAIYTILLERVVAAVVSIIITFWHLRHTYAPCKFTPA